MDCYLVLVGSEWTNVVLKKAVTSQKNMINLPLYCYTIREIEPSKLILIESKLNLQVSEKQMLRKKGSKVCLPV